jgi:hypothetical protein
LIDKLYEILATLHYNSERGDPLEDVLAKFLVNMNPVFDTEQEVREAFLQKMKQSEERHKGIQKGEYINSDQFKTDWFRQESLLLSNISQRYIPDYILGKYAPYEEEFIKKYDFDPNALWLFSFKFAEYFSFKQMQNGFADEVYAFESKKEYADLSFVKIPSPVYIEQWKNLITASKKELRRLFFGLVSPGDFNRVLDILSLKIDEIPDKKEEIHFPTKPFLQTNDDLILLTPSYLGRSLHTIYESLFKNCKGYLDSKGSTFERIALDLFRQTSTKLLVYNVEYGENNRFEADAIVAYKKSLWIVEASSHLPSKASLQGDSHHVRKDLNRTLNKCCEQGLRALKNIDTISLPAPYKDLGIKGIIIIVDGVYPNLNIQAYSNQSTNNIPLYVINYFDLRTLIEQPEISDLEEFLLWRTQRPMPVLCFDEKDYWNYYFDRYRQLKDIRDVFKSLQEKGTILMYTGYRFNRKDYLAKMPKE